MIPFADHFTTLLHVDYVLAVRTFALIDREYSEAAELWTVKIS